MYFDWLHGILPIRRIHRKHQGLTKRRRHSELQRTAVETLEVRVVPATYTVTGVLDGNGTVTPLGVNFEATTLRAAINAANQDPEPDTIYLPDGQFLLTQGELEITSSITIIGTSTDGTVLDGGESTRVLKFNGDNSEVDATLQNLTITRGYDTLQGAGILAIYSTLDLDHVVVANNHVDSTSSGYGGGIAAINSFLTISNSTISHNQVQGASGEFREGGLGGGIYTKFGILNLNSSTVSDNYAYGTFNNWPARPGNASGGGLYVSSDSALIENSTIANNAAYGGDIGFAGPGGEGFGGDAFGGGLSIGAGEGDIEILNSTIAYNNAFGGMGGEQGRNGDSYGGGIYTIDSATASLFSTIVANNSTSAGLNDLSGMFVSLGYNLIRATSADASIIGSTEFDLTGVDPLFATIYPVNNGGPTLTLALQATGSISPAIDHGFAIELTTDQRGLTRTVNSVPDIGAFEVQTPVTSPTVEHPIDLQQATEDIAFSFTFAADTFASPVVEDVLTYTTSPLPAWLSFNPATRTFTGTPRDGDVTSGMTITVYATNLSLASVSTSFLLAVLNVDHPYILARDIHTQTALEDSLFQFTTPNQVFNHDVEGGIVAYHAGTLPDWLSFDPCTLTFIGTPRQRDVTTTPLVITITAEYESGATSTTYFKLHVLNTNDAPLVVGTLANQTATEDSPFCYVVPSETFCDVDRNDILTYSASGLPDWLSFNPETRKFEGTPCNNDVTCDPITITVTATDLAHASASTTFTLTVINTPDAPTVRRTIDDQTATEDSFFCFIFSSRTFQDVDPGDTLTYSVSCLPDWLSFDPQTRKFSGTPANGDVTDEPFAITVTATDSTQRTASTTFQITVLNSNDRPSVAHEIDDQQATEDTQFSFVVPLNTFSDVDPGDTLTYSATGLPDWLTFDPATRTFSGTPDDQDTGGEPDLITVRVTDSDGATACTTFELSVITTAVNDHAPVFVFLPQTATVSQFWPNNSPVADVPATDADMPSQSLTYSILSGNSTGAFKINAETGAVTVADANQLDYSVNPTFSLVIQVTDHGTPQALSATTTLVVNVAPPEENSGPTISLNSNPTLATVGSRALIDPSATYTDERVFINNLVAPDFNGSQLSVSISAGRFFRDRLGITGITRGEGLISTRGSVVYYGNTRIGTYQGGSGNSPVLLITFNSSASTAAINALVKAIYIQAGGPSLQNRTVSMQLLHLEGVDSNLASRTVLVRNRRRPA